MFAKKSNATLSIPDIVLKQLRHDSEFENVSINQKVNHILLRWLLLYRAIEIQKAVVIPHETWRQIIDVLEEDFLSTALDHGADTVGATLAHVDIQPSIENVIEFIFSKISLYSGTISHFHHYKDECDNLHLIFEHSLGKKWSDALGKSFCRFFNQQYGLRTDLSQTSRIINITVHTRSIS
jgi:hypothetical protein